MDSFWRASRAAAERNPVSSELLLNLPDGVVGGLGFELRTKEGRTEIWIMLHGICIAILSVIVLHRLLGCFFKGNDGAAKAPGGSKQKKPKKKAKKKNKKSQVSETSEKRPSTHELNSDTMPKKMEENAKKKKTKKKKKNKAKNNTDAEEQADNNVNSTNVKAKAPEVKPYG